MQNDLQILDERVLLNKTFRMYGTPEEPLFLAKDVAEWIEHSDVSTMIRATDENEKVTNIVCTPGGNQTMWFLTEDGLYEVLMQSRKPIAKQFKHEVKEILKTIRKTGGYVSNDDMFLNTYLPNADEATKQFFKINLEAMKSLNNKIEQDKPKVLFADAVATSKNSILVGELAKILKQNGVEVGQNRLFEYLRNEGYLIRRKGTDFNMPTQRSMEMGLFEIKETSIAHSDGHITLNKTPKITGRGQQYFVNKYLAREA